RDATPPHAGACKEEQQSQMPAWAFQWARSGLTQQGRCGEGAGFNFHVASQCQFSGQLAFLGL
ncbi:MAG TPA: hypothetical protein PLL19_06615, partial [Thiobacillaceae bacterium]|nr:hypothetical protein [Thiobacillaceae bacterium]